LTTVWDGVFLKVNELRNKYNSTFKVHAEKNSQLKRSSMRRNGRSRLKAGRRTNDWMRVRRILSREFAAAGITSCELKLEGCWGDRALGFAHGRKRRHLKGDELQTLTILSCNICHDKIEYLPPEEMLAIVQDVIERRERR
jgi:hypothetical protein